MQVGETHSVDTNDELKS